MDNLNLTGRERGLQPHCEGALEDRPGWVVGSGQHFVYAQALAIDQKEIGKGAAGIDPE